MGGRISGEHFVGSVGGASAGPGGQDVGHGLSVASRGR